MVPPDPQPAVSNLKSSRSYVTAHKISLLVLIKEYCFVKQHYLLKRPIQVTDEVSWEHTTAQNRDFSSTMLKLIQNPDIDLKSLINIMHPVMHPNTYQLFLDRLNLIRSKGIAALLDFFATLDSLLVEPAPILSLLHKSSILGIFVRHMLLAFDKLTFSQQTKLCGKYHLYFDAAFDPYEGSNHIDCSEMKDEIEENLVEEEAQTLASQKQAEFFIAQQAVLLHINEKGALSSKELQQKINELITGNKELFEVYFLSYLNTMRVKEYLLSKENLFHHFDRNTTVPQELKSSAPSEDLARSSRYAALNLAIMHANFGHNEKALVALNEAIMLAQEVNDNVCLQYGLAWLYRLSHENEDAMVERSIVKSQELGLWNLASLGIQALTKLRSETTSLPYSVFDSLAKSDVQNCQHSMIDMMGSAYMLRAGLWSYYGQSMMNLLSSQLLLFLNTSDPIRGGIYHINEGTCLALRNLAIAFADEGFYLQSSQVLDLAKDLFPPNRNFSHIWKLADLIIKFEKALYRKKWTLARQIQSGITVIDGNEGKIRSAQLHLSQGNHREAATVLKQLLDQQDAKIVSPHFYARTLLLRGQLLLDTPNKDVALPLLMTCINKCKSQHLLGLEALATIQVAVYQHGLDLPNQAIYLLDYVKIIVMTHGTAYDKGFLLWLYGRCMALPVLQNLKKDFEECKKVLLQALIKTDTALEYLKKAQAIHLMKEILAWQAHVYHYLDMREERNNKSHRHRYLEDEFV